MASITIVKQKLNPQLKPPEPDNVEKILLLIDFKETSFETEILETTLGLKLLNKLLEDIDAIQAQ
jgi:hypothetical protein